MTPPKMVWDCSVSIAMAFEDERDDFMRRVFGWRSQAAFRWPPKTMTSRRPRSKPA